MLAELLVVYFAMLAIANGNPFSGGEVVPTIDQAQLDEKGLQQFALDAMRTLKQRQQYCTAGNAEYDEAKCNRATELWQTQLTGLTAVLRDQQQKARFQHCMSLFQSDAICRQKGAFFVWAQQLARTIIDGKPMPRFM